MKDYWDSSALVKATMNPHLRSRIEANRGFTRTHSLAEIFSALTAGNLSIRLDADDAARVVTSLLTHLDFVELTATEIADALKTAKRKGVRGGRVHDYLHAIAADKSGASELLTADQNDFNGLTALPIRQV